MSHTLQSTRGTYDPLPFQSYYNHVTDPNSPVPHEPSRWRYTVAGIEVPQGPLSFDQPPPEAWPSNSPARVLVGGDPNESEGPRYRQVAYAPPGPRDYREPEEGIWVLRDEYRNWRWNEDVEGWYDEGTNLDERVTWEEAVANAIDHTTETPPRTLFSHIQFPPSATLEEPPHDLQICVTSGIRGSYRSSLYVHMKHILNTE